MSVSSVSPEVEQYLRRHADRRTQIATQPFITSMCMAASDFCAVLASILAGVYIWSLVNPFVSLQHYFHLGIALALYVLVYRAFGLYSPAGFGPVEELRRIVTATLLVSLVLTAAAFLAKEIGTYSRGTLPVSGALISLTVPTMRSVLRATCAAKPWWGVPVLILGAGKTAQLLVEKLHSEPGLGLKPVACLDDDPAKQGDCLGVPVPGSLPLAPNLAEEFGIRYLLVAMPGVGRERLVEILERYGASFARIIVIPNLFGMASLWVSTHDMGGVLGLEVRQNLLAPVNQILKRAIDLALACALGLLALPILLVASIWIKIVSPGPAFYSQMREGELGAPLRVWKLRTMHLAAQRMLEEHLSSSPAALDEWNRHFKLRHDPRILPRIGHFLRRTSLDELPQLWNVIRGEMSLVGPRPFPAYHLDQFTADFRAFRSKVRPGLSGLWQVSARSDGDLAVQQELDTYYIRNWSLWLELHILARTISVVLRGQGAY